MRQDIHVQGHRLSPHQKRLWTLRESGFGEGGRVVVRLEGTFTADRLRQAIRNIIARHESLRTNFYREPAVKIPFQVVSEECDPIWKCVELIKPACALGEGAAWTDSVIETRIDFDVERGPLVRATLHSLQQTSAWLCLDIPGLCADHASLHNILREIALEYDSTYAESTNEEPVQYAQFSEWQNELLTEAEAEEGRQWWARQPLQDYPVVTLPFEQPPAPVVARTPQDTIQREVNPEELLPLQQRCRADRSIGRVVFASWLILLRRLTGEQHLLCWWRCDGRSYEELASGIGLFEKWIPVAMPVDGSPSFDDVLSNSVKTLTEAEQRQEYFSGPYLNTQVDRSPEGIGFEYDPGPGIISMASGRMIIERKALSLEPFKLRLSCTHAGPMLRMTWHYDPNRYSSSTLSIVADQLVRLLKSAAEEPTASIEALDIAGDEERDRLKAGCDRTVWHPDGPTLVHQMVEEHARRRPDAPAVAADDRILSYAELNARANQVAHGLRRQGVYRGTLVGLCLERSADMVVGLLGVLKAGAAYVPIDPAHAGVRLVPQLSQIGAAHLLTHLESVAGYEGTVFSVTGGFIEEDSADLNLSMSADELAYVIFTSGSTGMPKGVAVSHRNLMNYSQALASRLNITGPLHFATVSTLSADLGNTSIFPALLTGGCVHVVGYESATDGRLFASYMARHAIDVLKIVPSHFKALLATAENSQVCPRRYLVLGGERLTRALVQDIKLRSECKIVNHYGPTETTVGALTHALADSTAGEISDTVALGRPLSNLEAYVLDDRLEIAPVGAPGELYLGGDGLARGYLGQPDRTAERFVPHPFSESPGARLYRTGDLARFQPDGAIEFLGRVDHQVKIRGFRIELGEIEAMLAQHPSVQEAVVTVREDAQGEQFLSAYLVARGSAIDLPAVQEFLRSRLPDYMVPARWTSLPALPLTSNGKIDRRALPAPDETAVNARTFVAPNTVTEEILAGLWCDILKRDRVGIRDNFFDLGGHSLLATQVMSRLRQMFSVDLPLRTLFETTDLQELAKTVDSARVTSRPAEVLLPAPRNGPLPLSFAQQRLWVLAQLDPNGTAYNIPIALRIDGPLDLEALRRSFAEVVRRHEILRTTFKVAGGLPVQDIAPSLEVPLPLIDLRHLDHESRQAAVSRLAVADAQRPFDLQYGPLIRISALRLAAESHVLLVALHHIISDAWSAEILVREVTALYETCVHARPSPLPTLTLQYADFAVWQRSWLAGEVLEREMAYWRNVLGGELPQLELPTDRARPSAQTSHGALRSMRLPADESDAQKDFARRNGVTAFMLMLSAFSVLLSRYTEDEDIIVGTPVANRTRPEIESLIGFFVNTLALRIDLSKRPSTKEMLKRVREVCLQAYSHQDVPFEKLVEVLQPARLVGQSPIFQVMFDFQQATPPAPEISGLICSALPVVTPSAKFDLSMTVLDTGTEFDVSIEYNTDLFDESTISRMLDHFRRLLRSMVFQPDDRIADLEMLTEEERRQLGEWNVPAKPFTGRGFADLFDSRVKQNPDAIAVRCGAGTRSYRQLSGEADRIAWALRRHGIGPETIVAVIAERGIGLLAAMIALLKVGAVYLPLDPGHPPQRLRRSLQLSGAAHLLIGESIADKLARDLASDGTGSIPPMSIIERVAADSTASGMESPSFSYRQLAYVIFTSGSTGTPKGAMVEQGGLLNHLAEKCVTLQLSSEDVVAQTASQCFDISVWQFLAGLLCGAEICIIPDDIAHDPSRLLKYVAEAEVTVWETVPALIQGALDAAETTAGGPMPRLRWVLPTGEALSPGLCRRWLARFPHIPLMNAYGPAECADDVALHSIMSSPHEDDNVVPIGRPVRNVQLYVLSSAMIPVPPGIAGELCVGGIGVGRGYLNEPERTAGMFLPDPFSPEAGARLYRTGDRARYRNDGTIEFLGRVDHQVKLRGFRIELGEIESVLIRHAAAQEAVAVVREDRPGDRRLVAYFSPGAAGCGVQDVRRCLQEHLPDYMVPSILIELDRLPRNRNGKVDRGALPVPDLERELANGYAAPRSPIETSLAEMWADVLGVSRVGIHDNFFDLGGHSLLAVQLVHRLQQSMGSPVPLLAIFQYPTVATLASSLVSEPRQPSSPLVTLQAEGTRNPLYCIDPTGTHVLAYQPLAYALGNDQPVYGISLDRIFSLRWTDISIAQIAADTARLIRTRQPAGPYRLLGWSNGGVTALAIAGILESQGQTVEFLGILDTQLPVEIYSDESPDVVEEVMAYLQRERREEASALLESEREGLHAELLRRPVEERVEFAIRWAQKHRLLSSEESDASVEALKIGYALDKSAACVLNSIATGTLRAPIHAWWTSRTLKRHGNAPLDWQQYTVGAVRCHMIDGDHMEAVQSIEVHQRISEILNSVNERSRNAMRR